MSDTRRWTRPRTRVYDCNYNMGERYYKPVVDSLDRKYGGGIAERLAADEPISRRSPFESSSSRPSRGADVFGDGGDEEFDVGASLHRLKASRAARQELEDELESMSTERMMKKKAATAAAARESLLEDELELALSGGSRRRKANYSEQLLDTVGVNGKMHEKLVDEVSTFRRKAQSAIDDFNDELSGRTENSRRLVNLARQRADLLGEEHAVVTVRVNTGKKVPRLTKWTALNATSMTENLEESAAEAAAKARARKSKVRLADLNAEMEALTERGQQREMRVKGLRTLLAESSAVESSTTSSSSVQVERKRERKVNF